MVKPVLLRRVVLRNYKSYANCSVALGPLTFLVGPNGAGKSNFLDALRLVTESLTRPWIMRCANAAASTKSGVVHPVIRPTLVFALSLRCRTERMDGMLFELAP